MFERKSYAADVVIFRSERGKLSYYIQREWGHSSRFAAEVSRVLENILNGSYVIRETEARKVFEPEGFSGVGLLHIGFDMKNEKPYISFCRDVHVKPRRFFSV